MRDDYTEWEMFSHPDPDEADPPTANEIEILREFVEHYGIPDAIPAGDAAHRFMSLRDEDSVIEERRLKGVDKGVDEGERVAWLLWDAAIEMPRYQPAILKLVEAIRALPELDNDTRE
jgi:hypothetical protein